VYRVLQATLINNAVVAACSARITTEIFTDAIEGKIGACLVQGGNVSGFQVVIACIGFAESEFPQMIPELRLSDSDLQPY